MLRSISLTAALGIAAAASAQTVPYARYGSSTNQVAVGSAIDTRLATGSVVARPEPLTQLNVALGNVAVGSRAAAIGQLTPSSYEGLPDLTLRTVELEQQTVLRYLRDFRAGGTGVSGAAGTVAPGERKFGSFLIGSGQYGSFNAGGDRPRTGYASQGVVGGADYRFGARSLLGVMAGYNNADVRLAPASRNGAIRNWFGGVYGTLGVGPLYVDGFGSYGEAYYDLRRSSIIDSNGTSYAAETHSRTWAVGGTTGLSFNFAGFEFEPSAGIRYADLRLRGFTEDAAIGSLDVGQRNTSSLLSSAGLRVGGAYKFGDGTTVRPEVRGAWRHEFRDTSSRLYSYDLTNTGTGTLAYSPTPLERDYATVGAGFTVSGPSSPLSFVVDYIGEFARDRHINGVQGGARLTF